MAAGYYAYMHTRHNRLCENFSHKPLDKRHLMQTFLNYNRSYALTVRKNCGFMWSMPGAKVLIKAATTSLNKLRCN